MERYEVNQTITESAAWSTDVTSAAFPLRQYDSVGLVFSWAGLVGALTTTNFEIEVSNDATNWASAATAVSVGSNVAGVDAVSLADMFYTYIRVKANHGSVTEGSYKVTATLKC